MGGGGERAGQEIGKDGYRDVRETGQRGKAGSGRAVEEETRQAVQKRGEALGGVIGPGRSVYSHGQIMTKYKYGRVKFGGGQLWSKSPAEWQSDTTRSLSLLLIISSSHGSISAYRPPPVQDDHSMPSPSYSSFNPASYTRTFFGSPISWRPGSFGSGNRYFPGSSPSQLLECVLYTFPVHLSLLLTPLSSSLVLPTFAIQERFPPPWSRTEVRL